jgi:hypothetical protein
MGRHTPGPLCNKRRMRLDFLCIGTQKGGTTSLNAYLRQHQQLVVPDRELHFFDDETLNWSQPPLELYHTTFEQGQCRAPEDCNPDTESNPNHLRLCGEITPIYIYWEPCIERIHAYNAAIRLIVLLRNPLARAFSHWAMENQRGLDNLPFSEAIRQESFRCSSGQGQQHRVYSYLDRGRYAQQLQRVFRFFPRSQVLILRSEDLFQAPLATLRRLTDFLGISPFSRVDPIHARQGVYPQVLHQDDWAFMASELEQEISDLEALLGWCCDDWRTPWSPLA